MEQLPPSFKKPEDVSLARRFEETSVPPPRDYDRFDADDGREEGAHQRLHDYWVATRKHKWLILGIVCLVTMLVAIYMARKPDIYEARMRVQVDLENTNALGSMKNGSIFVNNPTNDPTYFNTQLEILSSAGLLSRVIKTLDLEHNQAFLNPKSVQTRTTWENMRRMVGLEGKEDKPDQRPRTVERAPVESSTSARTSREDLEEVNRLDSYVQSLKNNLTVRQLNDTRLIEVRFRHPDPQTAAKILNAIADAFVLANLEQKTETGATAGDFLQRRIAELQVEIRNGEERLINYAKNNQILSLDNSQNTVVERLTGLNRQLLEAENVRKTAEAAFRASRAPGAASARAESSGGGGGSTTAQNVEVQLAALRQKRAQLLVQYTEKYPEVKEIDEQIRVLENQIRESRNRATTNLTTNLETDYRQALAREQSLREAYNQQRAQTLTQNEAAINYRIIQQEIETNKSLLDGLLQRSKENDVVLAGTPNNVHVVDYSPIPKAPVGPRRLQGVMLGFAFSLIFAISLARYLDYLDDTLYSTDDIERSLRLPALAVIPSIGSLNRRRFLPNITALQKTNGNNNGNEEHPQLLLDFDARSPLAEAYRQLRTSVLLSSAGGAPQVLLVTSSQPSEGKTTTAVNTSLILEQTSTNVLVIDADMRRPRLHKILDLENHRGLSTILASKMGEAEILSMVQQYKDTKLYGLSSGPVPPNPAELIGSEQMRRLLNVLRANFEYIIIDSPPIASFTDGVLISTMVDGVLLVVHGGKASENIVRRSKRLLQDVGAKIFGVVLNNVDLRRDNYYYYRYYQNYSYYHKDAETEDHVPGSTAAPSSTLNL